MKKLSFSLLALFALLTFSCEIGLGASVDTEPPSLAINNPPVDSVIRDAFALSGTYSDDGTIDKVSAVIQRTGVDNPVTIEFDNGQLEADPSNLGSGTWKIVIDPTQNTQILDGTYQAIVTITDSTKRSTTQSTTFTVDNTAPVIVLQRPATDSNATLTNADTYGRVFSLEGLGADDNNIDHIDVMIYSDAGRTDLKKTVRLDNVPPSISQNVAEYGDEAYTAIYGNVDPADFAPNQFYCSIRAYDSAQRYPAGVGDALPDDDSGNSTDIYYLYEDIFKDVLKTTKITEVYHILSGTSSSSARSASDTNLIKTTLAEKQKTLGSFILDPKNNPTFTLAGKPTLTDADCITGESDYTVPNDSDITIQANVGLDNSPIVDDENFKVYFQKSVFKNGKYVPAIGKNGEVIPKYYPEIDSDHGKKKTGSNYQFTIHAKSDGTEIFEVGYPYIIGIEGKDENGQTFVPANNGYGFWLLSMAAAPTLKSITPNTATVYVGKEDSLTISGVTALSDGIPVVSLRSDDEEWATTADNPLTSDTSNFDFSLTINNNTFRQNSTVNGVLQSSQIALEIRSSNEGNSSSTYKTIMFDVDDPTVNDLKITPEITTQEHGQKYVLNGTVNVSALLEDAFTAVQYYTYEIWQNNQKIFEPAQPIASSKVNFDFDTSTVEDSKDLQIKIIVTDKAGNSHTESIECYVDQSTDKPTFTSQDGTSWKTGILNPYYISLHENDDSVAVKNIISGDIYSKITDDDSVSFVKLQVQAVDKKDGLTQEEKDNPLTPGYVENSDRQSKLSPSQKSALYSKQGKEISITHKMPPKAGFYLITQTVYDKNFIMEGTEPAEADELKPENQYFFTKESYVLRISGTGPQYSLTPNTTKISGNAKQKQLSVAITFDEGEAPYSFKRSIQTPDGNTVASETVTPSLNNGIYTDVFKVEDIYLQNSNTVVLYEVTDANGTTSKTVIFTKDETKPVISSVSIEPKTSEFNVYTTKEAGTKVYYLNNTQQFVITGSTTESELDTVDLVITNTKDTTKKIEKHSSEAILSFDDIKFAENVNGNSVLWLEGATAVYTITDKAGNVSDPIILNLKFDTTAPIAEHKIDALGKDIVFRIGDASNDDITSETAASWGLVWNDGDDSVDTDVGKKYSKDTYGNSETIKIRGNYIEDGSGINLIYYKIFDTQPNSNNKLAEDFLANYKNSDSEDFKADGYFGAKDSVNKRVFFNHSNNTKDFEGEQTATKDGKKLYYLKQAYNFITTISGFTEKKYLVLIAEDNVGNATLERVPVENESGDIEYYSDYQINVDNEAPSITIAEQFKDKTQFIKSDDNNATIKLFGVAEDNAAGINKKEFVVKINGKEITLSKEDFGKLTILDNWSFVQNGEKYIVKNESNEVISENVEAQTVSNTPTGKNIWWNIEIKNTAFSGILNGKEANVSVTLKDNAGAGNDITEGNLARIVIDTAAPTVSIQSPAENKTVNKSITISAITSDGTGAGLSSAKPELYYSYKTTAPGTTAANFTDNASTGWKKLEITPTLADDLWNYSVNTAERFDDNKTIFFTVKSEDVLGNVGYAQARKLNISQDSDRPEITIKSLTLATNTGTEQTPNWIKMTKDNPIWTKTNELWGTVTDDDGIEGVYIIKNDTEPAENADWGANCYSNGTWSYTMEEGFGTLWFKVEDSAGGKFISKQNLDALDVNTPKIKDKGANQYGYSFGSGVTAGNNNNVFDSTVYVQVDTHYPEIPHMYYKVSDSDTVNFESITSDGLLNVELDGVTHPEGWTPVSNNIETVLGGSTNRYLYVLYSALDANGIASCTEENASLVLASYSGSSTPITTDETAIKRLVRYDFSTVASGSNIISLIATDRANQSRQKDITITVDNTAPNISDTNRSNEEEVYGSLKVDYKGKTKDEQKQGIKELYFAVTKDSTKPAKTDFTEIGKYISSVSKSSWKITFGKESSDNNVVNSEASVYYAKYLNDYLDELYGENTSEQDALKDLYIWTYAVDELGNSGYEHDDKIECVQISVIPLGDKPTVTIDSPENGKTVGGTIQISGVSEVAVDSVADVYFQIDPDYNGSSFNANWASELQTLIDGKENIPYSIETQEVAGIGNVIKRTSGTAQRWTLSINTQGEFGKKTGNVNRDVAVRVYAISNTNRIMSEPQEVHFTVDPDRPVFSDLVLIQKDENGNAIKTQKYSDNIWLSGTWYLSGSVSHSSGIKTLDVRDKEYDSVTMTTSNNKTSFEIKVGETHTIGKSEFKIYAEAKTINTTQDSSLTVRLRYDNNAPTNFVPGTATITTLDTTANDYTKNKFKQNNGKFQLRGTVKESENESGLERIAFYFTRTISGTTYFIDPMVSKEKSSGTAPQKYRNNYVEVGGTTGVEQIDGLYWRKIEGATIKHTNEVDLNTTVPNNVRIGGLCKIKNVIYTIGGVDKSGKTITLKESLPAIGENEAFDVYFALAQVIDNKSLETGTTDIYNEDANDTMSNKDGDQMQEGIDNSGANYDWQASINSINIYDGPVQLHFVYYDAAGNSASSTYYGQFCNNAPRIASVIVASDYDGDDVAGNTTDEKSIYFPLGSENGKSTGATSETVVIQKTGGKAYKTLKGVSKIDVEIIGGNGNLWYSYNIGATAGANSNTIKGNSTTSLGEGTQDNDSYLTDGVVTVNANHIKSIELGTADFNDYMGKGTIINSSADSPTWFQYVIWDETDGFEKFSTSQNVTMQIALSVQVHDNTSPNVIVNPFFWNSASENSLYNNSSSNGHIELENDWKETVTYKAQTGTAATSGEFDADPKVSGKIVFRGSAWDNVLLKELWAKVSWTSESTAKSFDFENSLSGTNSSLAGYKKIAVYEKDNDTGKMVWTIPSAAIGDGWTFEVDKNTDNTYKGSLNAEGHKIYWTFTLDTEKLDGVCANDVTVSIRAVDSRGTSPISSATISGTQGDDASQYNKPDYRIDVVPYIKAISTPNRAQSGLKNSNIRSASGKYSVIKGSISNFITVEGFNLFPDAVRIVNDTTRQSGVTESSGNALTFNATEGNYSSFTISNNISSSGYLELFVNGVRTLNNINRDDAYGSYSLNGPVENGVKTASISDLANGYNREPDYYTTKNVTLTDDRYLLVWDMHKTNKKNGYYPVMIMDGNSPVFGYVDSSGRDEADKSTSMSQPADMQPQRRKFDADGTYTAKTNNILNTEYLASGTTWDQMAMAKDEGGRYHQISVYNRNGASMGYFYDAYAKFHTATSGNTRNGYDGRQMGTGYQNYNPDFSQNENNNALTLDAINAGTAMVDRFQSIKLIATGNSVTGNATVYQAYYDDAVSHLIFRQFMIGQSAGDVSLYTGYGMTNFTENTSTSSYATGRNQVDVNKEASKFYDFGIGTNGNNKNVVFVYYDFSEGRLKIRYTSTNLNGSPTQNLTWKSSSLILPDYVGQYVSMAVQGKSLHIAAFDQNDSDLVYIYVPDYTTTSTDAYTSMTVDAAGSVGNWTSIKIDKKEKTDEGVDRPYYNKPIIAYYNATETGGHDAIKLAIANDVVGSVTAGVADGYTSAGWEYMTIPSVDPAQGGNTKFQQVCLDFDLAGNPVVGYLATNLEFGKALSE